MPSKDHALSRWLSRLEARSAAEPGVRNAILSLPGTLRAIPNNRDFVALGERVDHACLIVSGMAARFSQTGSGDRQITALHIPGDMADLHSVVLPVAASALQSIGEAEIYCVPHSAFKAMVEAFPAVTRIFWRDSVVDAAILSQWSLVNGRMPALGRVAHLICELVCRLALGEYRDGASFEWPLTQPQMGEATGLTSVHVNRMMRELKDRNAASVQGKRVTILDWGRLRAIAEFDATYLSMRLAG